MSTHIPHGFRVAEGIDLEIFKRRVREVMDPLRDEEDVKLLSRTVAKYVDKQWLAGAPVPPSAVDTAYAEWADGQRQMSFHDFDHDVNRFELSVGTDPGNGRIMVIARAENDDLMDAFEDMPEVEEYGYWNSTDSYPEGVTEADWEIRETDWNRMIPRGGPISATMDTWVLRDSVEIRAELRAVGLMIASAPARSDRAKDTGLDAYADYLFQVQGVEVMRAVQHVAFGRGQSVRPVIDVVASYLPELTVELLSDGSGDGVIDPGYQDAVKAACAALYEQDKNGLARKD